MKRIENEWNGFLAAVDLDDAPVVQKIEMRRAFFAGAAAVVGVMSELAMKEEEHGCTDETDSALESLLEELGDFSLAVKNGVA
jgi:hypothetical protein